MCWYTQFFPPKVKDLKKHAAKLGQLVVEISGNYLLFVTMR